MGDWLPGKTEWLSGKADMLTDTILWTGLPANHGVTAISEWLVSPTSVTPSGLWYG